MAGTATRTDPDLWDEIKAQVTEGDKGGEPNQWSARKAQLAVAEYKKQGGGYKGKKAGDNHLSQWTREEWGTKSGKPSGETHERYLPKEARRHLTKSDYQRTTAEKQADSARGRQFSRQPRDVADKTAPYRNGKAELLAEAKRRGIPGRSRTNRSRTNRSRTNRSRTNKDQRADAIRHKE